MKHKIEREKVRLKAAKARLQGAVPSTKVAFLSEKLKTFQRGIDQLAPTLIHQKKQKLKQISEMLNAVNPQSILKKGYCIPLRKSLLRL